MTEQQQPTLLYGARVSRPGSGDTILVEQTSRLNIPKSNNPYTIDQDKGGGTFLGSSTTTMTNRWLML